MMLSQREKERYSRQMIMPGWDIQGQEKLRSSTVFIAGAGGLGSPVSLYLAAAGVGTLRICDCGEPELSNLNRQILHDESRIGCNKAVSAKETLKRINPDVKVEPLEESITDCNVADLAGDASIIVDCLDNFETRHVLNRYSVKTHTAMIHAGIHGMNGQVTFIHPPETPCLWCIFPGDVPVEVFPVVGATAGVIGCIEALEAIKFITGYGVGLSGQLLIWDGGATDFQKIEIKKDPACPVCAKADDL